MNKNKYVSRFDKETAPAAHKGTIKAGRILPKDLKSPFGNAWGYMEGKGQMEPHSHAHDEVYMVFSGKAWCTIDGDRFEVEAGDIITIPPSASHTVECEDGETFLWAAFWWEHIE